MLNVKSRIVQNLFAVTCTALLSTASFAESPADLKTESEVRTEVSEAMAAVASYAEQERDAALTQARSALEQLDATIDATEDDLRETWADMSDEAKDAARRQMKDLRQARNVLSERYGALEAGSTEAWIELKDGFVNAWDAFAETWDNADGESDTS